MKRLLTISTLVCFFCLLGFSNSALAQSDDATLTDEGSEQIDGNTAYDELGGTSSESDDHTMWSDPLYYQFEKMLPRIARSIGRLDTRISTLAVININFSPNLDEAFRKVLETKLYGQLLLENPRLKLIKCDVCNRITSSVKNGILTISRGLKDPKSRRQLADKLGVQGFMSTIITEEDRQLAVVLHVHDAEEGRIILSDVIAGDPVPKSQYWHFYAGELLLPIKLEQTTGKTVEHSAVLVGIEYTMRFAEDWIVGSNLALYMDNNEELGTPDVDYIKISPGLLFDGSISWEAVSMIRNNATLLFNFGIGEFLSPQFNFSVYYRLGAKLILGQSLSFNFAYYSFPQTNLEKPVDDKADHLTGSATSITFGYQF